VEEGFTRDVWAAAKSRPVIEQAKGILMAHRKQSADEAFAELVEVSQLHNVKLATLSTALTAVTASNDDVPAPLVDVVATHWPELVPMPALPQLRGA
jgi:hypothetical protein